MTKKLIVGNAAPVIHATDLWGKVIIVPAKDKWIYLSFHRFAACPFCNLRTNELIRNYDRFEQQHVEIVSLWPSDKDSLLRHVGSEKSPFPMVSDEHKRIYKAYGVTESSFAGALRLMMHPRLVMDAMRNKYKNIEIDVDPKLMPASFLVDPDGAIQMAYYGKHYGDHPKIESIFLTIDSTKVSVE
jgi:thioredoxin-dependent peroxiredoxin